MSAPMVQSLRPATPKAIFRFMAQVAEGTSGRLPEAERLEARPTWYSGRGMFGKECLAVTGPLSNCQALIALTIDQLHDEHIALAEADDPVSLVELSEDFYELTDRLLEFSMDHMGLDVVLYFKRLPKPETPQEN